MVKMKWRKRSGGLRLETDQSCPSLSLCCCRCCSATFQIYHPLIDHEAINAGQSFRVITVQVNENRTLASGVHRETASVLDKCWSLRSYNSKSCPWIYFVVVQPEIKDEKSSLMCCSSNKFRAFTGFPFLKRFEIQDLYCSNLLNNRNT